MKEVIINTDALLSLILSSIEVYKRETFGIILGTKKGKVVRVMRAIPYLTAKRDYEYTSINIHRERRINSALAFLTAQKILGDYHSHPEGPDLLGKHDRKELMKMNEEYVAILVSVKKIRPAQKSKKWKNNQRDLSICGPIANKYFIKVYSFIHEKKKDRIIKIRARSTSIQTFNKKLKKYKEVQAEVRREELVIKRKLKRIKELKKRGEAL